MLTQALNVSFWVEKDFRSVTKIVEWNIISTFALKKDISFN